MIVAEYFVRFDNSVREDNKNLTLETFLIYDVNRSDFRFMCLSNFTIKFLFFPAKVPLTIQIITELSVYRTAIEFLN